MKRYPKKVDDAIYALMGQGTKPSQILELLHAGDAAEGLEPCPMPRRTFFDHVRKLREERGEPVPDLPPGEAADLSKALEREALELARKEIARLRRKQAKEGLSSRDVETVRKLMTTLDDIQHRKSRRAELASGSQPQRASLDAGRKAPLLDRLQRPDEGEVPGADAA